MIKNHCVSCGEDFENTPYHYNNCGNYCDACHAKIAQAAIEKRKEVKSTINEKYGWSEEERPLELPYAKNRLIKTNKADRGNW
jgi:hypothetical protein